MLMTQTTDGVEIEDAIVVTLDICSSSVLIEDLMKNNRSKLWRDLLINMKEYLLEQVPYYNAELHKFIGDGWITFFRRPYASEHLLRFLYDTNWHFMHLYEESVVPRQSSLNINGQELVLQDLAHKHSRISDYLTAYHVTHEFLGLARKELFDTENLRYVYPHRINRLAKELINRDSKRQIDFAQILDKLLKNRKVQNYAKAQACYLAGRLEDMQAKPIALSALRGHKSRMHAEAKRGTKDKRINLDDSHDRLLLERTIYISMAFLGDENSEGQYLDLLFSNRRMDLVNRGFHLEYYGDQDYDPTRPLTSADHLKKCPKTFQKLIQNLTEGPQQNTIYELELFTLCSLAQKRYATRSLDDDDRTKIHRLLKVLIRKYSIKHCSAPLK
jgi:hypothetical protein